MVTVTVTGNKRSANEGQTADAKFNAASEIQGLVFDSYRSAAPVSAWGINAGPYLQLVHVVADIEYCPSGQHLYPAHQPTTASTPGVGHPTMVTAKRKCKRFPPTAIVSTRTSTSPSTLSLTHCLHHRLSTVLLQRRRCQRGSSCTRCCRHLTSVRPHTACTKHSSPPRTCRANNAAHTSKYRARRKSWTSRPQRRVGEKALQR